MTSAIKSIRGLLASVRSSIMDSTNASVDDVLKTILTFQEAGSWSDITFSNIIKCKEGATVLQVLRTEFLIHKVVHCKKKPRKIFKDVVEHEFVVVHLRHKGKNLMFRIDRAIGSKSTKDQEKKAQEKKKDKDQPSTSDSGSGYTTQSSGSSRSSTSIESILMYPSRLVNNCVCQLSNISSSRHWARDTIHQIPKYPDDSYVLTTIDFSRSTSTLPNLWDLVHLVQFVNRQCDEYSVVDAQCYWYSDLVSGILEFWCQDATVTHYHGWQGTKSKNLSIPGPGTFKGIPIHKRDVEMILDKKAAFLTAAEASLETTERLLDSESRAQRIQADADAKVELLSRQLREAELRRKEGEERAEARVNKAEEEVRKMAQQMKQGEERVKAAEERAEASVKAVEERAEARVKAVEERAEARVAEMERQMKESEERAEARAKSIEERNSARDDVLERIMAHLSKHNTGNPIVL